MKLPDDWKDFYLRSLKVPLLGKSVFGPLLRGFWKTLNMVAPSPSAQRLADDGLITTYASTITGLRRQVERLEEKIAELETRLGSTQESLQASTLLLASAVEGVSRKQLQQQESFEFHQGVTTAALSSITSRR